MPSVMKTTLILFSTGQPSLFTAILKLTYRKIQIFFFNLATTLCFLFNFFLINTTLNVPNILWEVFPSKLMFLKRIETTKVPV